MKTFTLGALLFALPAFATTVIALDVPAMSRAADSIVVGKVARVEPKMSKDGRRITTTITVEVSDALKGEGGATTLDIVQPGGIVGDVGQKVSGTATFKVGEEVVTFLERRGAKAYQLVGMAQGCFHVERSSDGAAAFVVPDSGELLTLDPVTHAPVARGVAPMKLDELKSVVRAALAPPGVAEDPKPNTGPILRESVK